MPGNMQRCQIQKQDSLYDFSVFSVLDYNLISSGIQRQSIFVNNVLPLPRVRSCFLAACPIIRIHNQFLKAIAEKFI